MSGLNHADAISIYCLAPVENTLEVYVDTPWYLKQPHGGPLDPNRPDAEIWAETERIVKADLPSCRSPISRSLRGTPTRSVTRSAAAIHTAASCNGAETK
jgi:catechol 2,3-dioxygenase